MDNNQAKIKQCSIILRMLRALKFTVEEDYVDENLVNLFLTNTDYGIAITLNIDIVGMEEGEVMEKLSKAANSPSKIIGAKEGGIL